MVKTDGIEKFIEEIEKEKIKEEVEIKAREEEEERKADEEERVKGVKEEKKKKRVVKRKAEEAPSGWSEDIYGIKRDGDAYRSRRRIIISEDSAGVIREMVE